MRKRQNLPGQMQLNFEGNSSDYLSWIELKTENDGEYEAVAKKFYTTPFHETKDTPIWHEIVYALNR